MSMLWTENKGDEGDEGEKNRPTMSKGSENPTTEEIDDKKHKEWLTRTAKKSNIEFQRNFDTLLNTLFDESEVEKQENSFADKHEEEQETLGNYMKDFGLGLQFKNIDKQIKKLQRMSSSQIPPKQRLKNQRSNRKKEEAVRATAHNKGYHRRENLPSLPYIHHKPYWNPEQSKERLESNLRAEAVQQRINLQKNKELPSLLVRGGAPLPSIDLGAPSLQTEWVGESGLIPKLDDFFLRMEEANKELGRSRNKKGGKKKTRRKRKKKKKTRRKSKRKKKTRKRIKRKKRTRRK